MFILEFSIADTAENQKVPSQIFSILFFFFLFVEVYFSIVYSFSLWTTCLDDYLENYQRTLRF